MWITTCVQILPSQSDIFSFFFLHTFTVEEFIRQPGKAHRLQQSGIKGFSSATGFPFFHLKAVTKVVFTQQRGVKPGCPRFPPVCAKAPNTGSCSATWTTTCHSKWLQRKEAFQEKNRGKKKRNTGGWKAKRFGADYPPALLCTAVLANICKRED